LASFEASLIGQFWGVPRGWLLVREWVIFLTDTSTRLPFKVQR